MTKKSPGTKNLPTCTGKSSTIPNGSRVVVFTNWIVRRVGLSSHTPIL